MSRVYIYDGTEWCNTCAGAVKVKVPSGDWIQVDPMTNTTKYFDGTDWILMDCCYEITVAPEVIYPPEIPSKLHTGNYGTPMTFPVMNFNDNPDYIPTCDELKNICCVEGYPDYGTLADDYRASRDCFIYSQNYSALAEHVGSHLYQVLNYNQWLPGGLADQTVYIKGGLMNYEWIWGCPECTKPMWHEFYFDYLTQVTSIEIINTGANITDGVYTNIEFTSPNGLYFTADITVIGNIVTTIEIVKKGSGYTIDEELTPVIGQLTDNGSGIVLPIFKVTAVKDNRVVDILPTITGNTVYLSQAIFPDTFPTTGNPGEILRYTGEDADTNYYAWDPIMQLWSIKLGEGAIRDLATSNSAKRDAYLYSFNTLNLAHAPFITANESFPFHRWNSEII